MRRRGWFVGAVVVAGAAALGLYGVAAWQRRPALPPGLIQANGRIEGDEITVAVKVGGRIAAIGVREGDLVTQGQLLVRLEDQQAQAKLAQAIQGEIAIGAQLRAAQSSVRMLELEVPLSIDVAESAVKRAEAAVHRAESREAQAARDARRFAELASRGSLGLQKSEAAHADWLGATADVAGARAALEQADRQLAQAHLGRQRIETERHRLQAIEAQSAQARAIVADAQSVVADLQVTAPAAGVVMTRTAEPGEVVAAGAPLLTLVDLDRLYLKVYVPEPQIGKVRIGVPARVYVDAFGDRFFPATLKQIASRAEFTPREVQSSDERVKLVYAAKLYLDGNPDHCLTPGLPADAIIQHEEEAPWVPPRR